MKKVLIKTAVVSVIVLFFPFIITLLLSDHKNNHSSLDMIDFEIYYEINDTTEKLSFDEYLIGIVAANMPASYDMEALKTQAVISRTYALYNISLLSEKEQHENQYTTSELGLSYISLSAFEQYWGIEDYINYFTKIENAVYGTRDEILVYDNNLILPVFFSTGSGFTRNASEAWGIDIPYLVSVSSKQDVTSINYLNISESSVSSVISLLQTFYPDNNVLEENFFEDISVSERDSTGYVTKIDVGNTTISGEDFAKILGLTSNHFYIENYEDKVRMICNGVGHGVGLSQYGANAMANDGSTYENILKHYYTGVQLIDMNNED